MITAVVAGAMVVIGAAFAFVAGLGVWKMPDTYTRLHAATKAGPLGAGFVACGEAGSGGLAVQGPQCDGRGPAGSGRVAQRAAREGVWKAGLAAEGDARSGGSVVSPAEGVARMKRQRNPGSVLASAQSSRIALRFIRATVYLRWSLDP